MLVAPTAPLGVLVSWLKNKGARCGQVQQSLPPGVRALYVFHLNKKRAVLQDDGKPVPFTATVALIEGLGLDANEFWAVQPQQRGAGPWPPRVVP